MRIFSTSSSVRLGYASKFKVFEEARREQAPLQANAYLSGGQAPGNFRCTESKYAYCCKGFSSAYAHACSSGYDTIRRACETSPRTVRHRGLPTPIQGSQAHIHLINETKVFSELIDMSAIQTDWVQYEHLNWHDDFVAQL
ncbi:exo-1,3-beta-D-glucanase [Colletotrichum sojae]|uniref:Exo-1,3-beta-D-glucanase n=1 Tax=Colletotrichum sojae TaxID=2175907 RepID=A0A8H6ILQ2_9PEZI|nr:exo-1,3-beta-D-glucanase [Colletotrichum sojae]